MVYSVLNPTLALRPDEIDGVIWESFLGVLGGSHSWRNSKVEYSCVDAEVGGSIPPAMATKR